MVAVPVFGDWRLPSNDDQEAVHSRCDTNEQCSDGLILPLWLPHVSPDEPFVITYRAVIYGLALAYLLFGVSIITDRIVSATEVMASQKRTVTVKLKSGGTTTVQVPVWHPVVAGLTFGVVGTSSPEILLPIVEVFHRGFKGDQLGPALIVGSGAYHLLIITSICLLSVSDTEAKPIKDLHLFFTTGTFAIAAYMWVYFILDQISPGIIELWEAVVTLAMFPGLIFVAWAMSRRLPEKFVAKIVRRLRKSIPARKRKPQQPRAPGSSDVETPPSPKPAGLEDVDAIPEESEDESPEDERRRKLAALMQQLRTAYPEKSKPEIEEIARLQMIDSTAKSAAFYRLQTTKSISGTKNLLSMEKMGRKLDEQRRTSSTITAGHSTTVQMVGFATASNTCHESCGSVVISVKRWGAGWNDTSLTLDYETLEGSAKANVNFEPTSGKLKILAGQQFAEISVKILDDDIFNEVPQFFTVKLSNPIYEYVPTSRTSSRGEARISTSYGKVSKVEVAVPETKVSILDDDHCGVFVFERHEMPIPDNIGVAKIRVVRSVGAKGRMAVPYRITPGTAKSRQDYMAPSKGVLHFHDGQSEAFIDVKIIDKNRFGEVYTFFIELLPPKKESTDVKSTIGDPTLGETKMIQIGICEDTELEQTLDRLLKMTDLAEYFISSSWKDQLKDAFTVFHDEDAKSSCSLVKAHILHAFSLPWKVLVALLPPAWLLHGWLAFVTLMSLMAFVAALIGDCATQLGCTIGLKDTITAITLIPFGMGLPDTFASRRAAIYETTADAAIGQITGSNAVSVFLGMGMAWTIGAIYRTSKKDYFRMPPANFGFSVMLYSTFATAGVLVLLLRRLPPVRGELGGPTSARIISSLFFISLWILFIVLSSLETYCVIDGFSK